MWVTCRGRVHLLTQGRTFGSVGDVQGAVLASLGPGTYGRDVWALLQPRLGAVPECYDSRQPVGRTF